ncbi:MAG: hypothetical protein R6V31_05765 [Halohasta sp.]
MAGLWTYYRQYTHSAIHAAAAAALTIFGLLVFIDPLFAAVAIAAYVCPPIVLYVLGVDVGSESGPVSADRPLGSDSDSDDGDSDSDSDSDGADGDTDSDGSDTDSDGVSVDA